MNTMNTKEAFTEKRFLTDRGLEAIYSAEKWGKAHTSAERAHNISVERIERELADYYNAPTVEYQLKGIGDITTLLVGAGLHMKAEIMAMRALIEKVTIRDEKPRFLPCETDLSRSPGVFCYHRKIESIHRYRARRFSVYEDLYYSLVKLVDSLGLTRRAYADILAVTTGGGKGPKDMTEELLQSLTGIADKYDIRYRGCKDYSIPENRMDLLTIYKED